VQQINKYVINIKQNQLSSIFYVFSVYHLLELYVTWLSKFNWGVRLANFRLAKLTRNSITVEGRTFCTTNRVNLGRLN